MLGFLERLECPYSILTGAVDAGSSVGSGDASAEDSKADVISGGSRRRSGSCQIYVVEDDLWVQ